MRKIEDEQMDQKRQQYDRAQKQRLKRLQNELDEQSYNYYVYKEEKIEKQLKFDKHKAMMQKAQE